MIERSVTASSIVWACACGARDLALTEANFVAQVDAHLATHAALDDDGPDLKRAAETLSRYGRRHGV